MIYVRLPQEIFAFTLHLDINGIENLQSLLSRFAGEALAQ
jgi:hypothetical protein